MKRILAFALMTFVFSVTNAQMLSAMVMFIPIKKGEVPSMVQTPELRQALSAVPPLGGTSTVGSWNHCTLYYRGTQESLQQLLDDIDQLDGVQIRVSIDPSGKLGKVESTKFRPLVKPLVFQFSVTVSGLFFRADRASTSLGKNSPVNESVSITIHNAGGIDPSKLRLPKSTTAPTVTAATKAPAETMPAKTMRAKTDPAK